MFIVVNESDETIRAMTAHELPGIGDTLYVEMEFNISFGY